MGDLHTRERGKRLDDVIPPESSGRSVLRPFGTPARRVENPYLDHRLSREVEGGLACDCGETFGSATELGQHQQPYRHPKPREGRGVRRR